MGNHSAQTGCLSSFQSSAQQNTPRIALVNIMDNAAGTERHFVRTLLKANPLSDITLYRMACAKKDHKYFDEQEYLLGDNYVDWHGVIGIENIDLVIVTGINRGTLSYTDLEKKYPDFWAESQDLFRAIHTSLSDKKTGHAAFVCWSAFAAMKTLYGVEKGIRPQKLYGLFDHKIENPNHPLAKGFGTENMFVPQSRSSFMKQHELDKVICDHNGDTIMSGPDGPAIWTLENNRMTCFINHLEYGFDTLANEYARDKIKIRPDFPPPENYNPSDLLNRELLGTFDRLSQSCSHFYKNLIDLAQTQKNEPKNTSYELTQPYKPLKRSA